MSFMPCGKFPAEEFGRDQAVAAEHQDRGHGDGEGRGNDGYERQDVHPALARRAAAHHGVGEDEAQYGAEGGGEHAHDHRVAHSAPQVGGEIGIHETGEVFDAEGAVPVEKGANDDPRNREEDEGEDEQAGDEQAHQQYRVAGDEREFPVAMGQVVAQGQTVAGRAVTGFSCETAAISQRAPWNRLRKGAE